MTANLEVKLGRSLDDLIKDQKKQQVKKSPMPTKKKSKARTRAFSTLPCAGHSIDCFCHTPLTIFLYFLAGNSGGQDQAKQEHPRQEHCSKAETEDPRFSQGRWSHEAYNGRGRWQETEQSRFQ